jgi:hypothetical protein
MRINKKALQLIEGGLSSNIVSNLSESQINDLHSKLFSEQINVSKSDTATISKLKSEKKAFQMYEKEVSEDEDIDLTKDPDATDDGMGMFENDVKPGQPNPYSICHSQVGPKKSRKWERCVREIKKQLKEGKNPVSLFLENQIMRIVEKNLPPRITKSELMRYLNEQQPQTSPGTKPAPAKNPGTKTPPKPRPAHPGKNPNPGVNPAPKAKRTSPEQAKDEVINAIMNLLQK